MPGNHRSGRCQSAARNTTPGEQAQNQHDHEQGRRWPPAPQRRQSRRQQHPDQRKALAPSHPAALRKAPAALPRRPSLVQDAQPAVGQVAERERCAHPDQQTRRRQGRRRRKKQSRKAQRHGQRHQHRCQPHRLPRVAVQPVAPTPEPRVHHRVHTAAEQQHRAQSGQRHAVLLRVHIGQMHIHRQGHKGQRQAQQSIRSRGLTRPGRRCQSRRGAHGCRPCSNW